MTNRLLSSSTSADSQPRWLTVRLCALVFLAYTVPGSWLPVFTLHLKSLEFTPDETAWASATVAVGSVLSPLIWGQIADRWLAVERCVSLCGLACAFLQWLLASLTDPAAIILTCIVNWFFQIPVMGLSNSFVFRTLEHPERDYGKIRLWGTVGWMAAGWCLSLWMGLQGGSVGPADWSDSFRLGGLAGLLLAVYALTMPHTPPHGGPETGGSPLARLAGAPLEAVRLLRDRSFGIYFLCMFAVYATMPFATQLNPLVLDRIGVSPAHLPTYLTIAQPTEVITLAILPLLTLRLGLKKTLLLGHLAWTTALVALSVGSPLGLVLMGLAAQGIFISCFVVLGQVFINRQATHDIRASVQGLFVVVSGLGQLIGNLLVGAVRDLTEDRFSLGYLMAAAAAALSMLIFLAGFETRAVTSPAISEKEPLVPGSEMP
jgi:nucleoside transporter